jgi:uncharacterized protein YjiS (DUF1127 family)
MRANFPVLPIAAAPVAHGFLVVGAFVVRWVKQLARALRHHRETAMLAGMDEHMLADIGLTRSDVRDAVSELPWNDPTALLRARAIERRLSRRGNGLGFDRYVTSPPLSSASGFRQMPTDRPARYSV